MRITGYKQQSRVVRQCSLLSSNSGFTLLELIVVIFIISIILAVSLPSFTGLGESRLKSDTKKAASIMRYLNDTAITTKDSIEMKVDLKDKTIYYKSPAGEKKEKLENLKGITLQSKGLVSEGEVAVFFNMSGAAENIQLHLSDGKNATTVELTPSSGRVRVKDLPVRSTQTGDSENEKR